MSSNLKSGEQSIGTRDRILDAAESLFVKHGFAATSLRAIASLAKVNLAATNYHFGSKEGLYAAAIHRCVGPISAARLEMLDELEASQQEPTVELILVAFFTPFLREEYLENFPKLMGRIYAEPESLTRPVLQNEFSEVAQRFISALGKLLPDVNEAELRWRFHFLIGSMNQLLNFDHPMGLEDQVSVKQSFEKLLAFVAAGLKQSQQKVIEL